MAIFLRCVIRKPFYEMQNPIPAASDITVQELVGKNSPFLVLNLYHL
jgi:hypothetical protein